MPLKSIVHGFKSQQVKTMTKTQAKEIFKKERVHPKLEVKETGSSPFSWTDQDLLLSIHRGELLPKIDA